MLQLWETIINTAMMGTDKKQVSIDEVPGGLHEVATLIHHNSSTDKEEKFLQLAAVTLNYRQCGISPLQKQVAMQPAPAEERPYCNAMASRALNHILGEDSIPLLKFWLQHCYHQQQIVPPEMVPVLLEMGTSQKKLQLHIAACCGKRGEWLAGFNPAWNFGAIQTNDELWQTGTPEQRRDVLSQTRQTDPVKALEWLQSTWSQEDTNSKVAFLEILEYRLSENDLSFLESLTAEKSKKVKEQAMVLLKKIPASTIVRLYEATLRQAINIKKEKTLLGMISKTTLQCQQPGSIDEAIYKSGIEKLSNTKDFTDDEFLVFQLAQAVPPVFWELHLALDPQQIISLFQKDPLGRKLLPALIYAIHRFGDKGWAMEFVNNSDEFDASLLTLLPLPEQERFSNNFFDRYPEDIIRYSVTMEHEWSLELAIKILRYAAKNVYQYHRSFYNNNIHLIPAQLAHQLERLTPVEAHLVMPWSNTSEYISKLLTLKEQTLKAFHS